MIRRVILPLAFGAIGIGILLGLGFWQLARLEQKEAYLAQVDAALVAAPVALPAEPNPVTDKFRAVIMTGQFTGEALDVLVSRKEIGAGVRVIEAFVTDTGQRIMVDRGFVLDANRKADRTTQVAEVTGNLHWPDETDSYTPAPDAATGLWFARDVAAMADALKTDALLVVARSDTGGGVEPMPVASAGIPNDHLQYAITWFSLAVVWAGMTALFVWRNRRKALKV
jgi:surfeit locus 1 family protein